MRLLFYTEELAPGGAQINAISLGKALTERGHRVWFAADDGPLISRAISAGMDCIRVPYSSKRHPAVAIVRSLVSIARIHRIDLIQAFEYYPILEAYAASLWSRKPMYGIAAMNRIPSHYRFPKRRGLGLVSAETKEHFIRRLGWDQEKLHLIVARLDCDYYRPRAPGDSDGLSEHGIRPGEHVALLVSRMHALKWATIELFLAAAQHWEQTRSSKYRLRFAVVGGGPLLENVREAASRIPGRPVVVTGELTDIPTVMNRADVVIGMASTCQQGLACGRPVIVIGDHGYTATVAPENLDLLAHHHFNLHRQAGKGQPETLCRQLEATVFSPERALELGQFGRRIALERYDSRIGARQLEDIYHGLIAKDGHSPVAWLTRLGDLLLSLSSLYSYKVRGRIRRVRERGPFSTG